MFARIDVDAPVFTLINTFSVTPARQEEVIASLRRFTEEHARHLPGFLATAVHASLDGTRVVNYVQWRDGAALQAMLAAPEAREHMAEVAALADHIDPVPFSVAYVRAAG